MKHGCKMRVVLFTTVIVVSWILVGSWCSNVSGQVPGEGAARTAESTIRADDGVEKLTAIMSSLTEKRDAHTALLGALKDEAERQTRASEFPPIEKELRDLVELERQYRGDRIGCLAITHLCAIAASYAGTERPIHAALNEVLGQLHEYGHLRVIAIGFDRLVSHDGVEALPALTRLIESQQTLPFVRDSARLCRARWQLEMVENRRAVASELETLSDATEIERIKEYLRRSFPTEEEAARWKEQAIGELDELEEGEAKHRVIAFKATDAQGIVLAEDSERTEKGPTIADLAKGLLFRARHLSPGATGPKMEIELVTGGRWALLEQRERLVIVQFSFKRCAPCERQYPVLREIATKYPDQVSILSLMADDAIETTQEAVGTGKMTWNVAWDGKDGPLATQWGVRQFPTLFIFGKDQKMIFSGDIPAEFLAEVVDALLAQRVK